jgi:hypothetical protein
MHDPLARERRALLVCAAGNAPSASVIARSVILRVIELFGPHRASIDPLIACVPASGRTSRSRRGIRPLAVGVSLTSVLLIRAGEHESQRWLSGASRRPRIARSIPPGLRSEQHLPEGTPEKPARRGQRLSVPTVSLIQSERFRY